MMNINRRGFILAIVVVMLSLLMLMGWAVVNIGCGEMVNTRMYCDVTSAYYVAQAAAELRYAHLATQSTIAWSQTQTGTINYPDGTTCGTYSFITTPNSFTDPTRFYIISTGTVNGHTATAIASFGCDVDYTGAPTIAAGDSITLNGANKSAHLSIDGAVASNGDITQTGTIDIAGTAQGNMSPPFEKPDFWLGEKFDTNNDGDYAVDSDGNGVVTLAEAQAQGKEAAFSADNAYHSTDGVISGADSIYHYYTSYLNDAANNALGAHLNIAPGEGRYYSGSQVFTQGSIPNDVAAIFVDGDVTIDQNDQNWLGGGAQLNHTIVATGNVTINQPTNRPGDILTIVANGNIYTTGEMGNEGGLIGNFVLYSNGNVTLEHGGKMHASIFASGDVIIDTIGTEQGKDHRTISLMTIDWTDSTIRPVGIPPGYPDKFSFGFKIIANSGRWYRM